jgi:hypothetical protein
MTEDASQEGSLPGDSGTAWFLREFADRSKIHHMFDMYWYKSLRAARVLVILAVAVASIALATWPTAVQSDKCGDGNACLTAALVEAACVAVPRANDSRVVNAWTQFYGWRLNAGLYAQGTIPNVTCPHPRPPRAALSLHHILLI